MNQSPIAKQALTAPTSVQNISNVILLREIKHQQIQARRHAAFMLRQRLSGALLLVIGLIVWGITKDLTVILFLSPIYGSMLFSKKYIMLFK